MSGFRPARSAAASSGSWAELTLSSAVPKGTTPSCIRRSISWPRMPARSKGTISALTLPPVRRGKVRLQNGSS